MQKMLVETTGSFMLVDPGTNAQVQAGRPSVVPVTSFIQMRIGMKQIKVVISGLDQKATDLDFALLWKENKKTAVDKFNATFGVKKTEQVVPSPNEDNKSKGLSK